MGRRGELQYFDDAAWSSLRRPSSDIDRWGDIIRLDAKHYLLAGRDIDDGLAVYTLRVP